MQSKVCVAYFLISHNHASMTKTENRIISIFSLKCRSSWRGVVASVVRRMN